MGLDKEEEIAVLYALYQCGGKGSKACIIFYVTENHLLKAREGDESVRTTGETSFENDLAWARENLKGKGELPMPKHGIWQITEKGRERLFRVANAVFNRKPDEDWFVRYAQKLIDELFGLGEKLATIASVATQPK